MYNIYTYICLKCTQFLKINTANSLSVHTFSEYNKLKTDSDYEHISFEFI